VRVSTIEKLVSSGSDDDEQRQQFCIGEDILNTCGPFDVVTIDERQDAWNEMKTGLSAGSKLAPWEIEQKARSLLGQSFYSSNYNQRSSDGFDEVLH
jgi:hypothetical protein